MTLITCTHLRIISQRSRHANGELIKCSPPKRMKTAIPRPARIVQHVAIPSTKDKATMRTTSTSGLVTAVPIHLATKQQPRTVAHAIIKTIFKRCIHIIVSKKFTTIQLMFRNTWTLPTRSKLCQQFTVETFLLQEP